MRISDQRLSPHFFLSELVRSETAERLAIDNTPPPEVIERLRQNAAGMEQVRALLAVAVHVSSGYRCEALERVLCEKDFGAWCRRHSLMPGEPSWRKYFLRKQHPWGLATDFTAPAYGPPIAVCRAVAASAIAFDQLIFEHTWAHISWTRAGAVPRREVLTLAAGGYVNGIAEREAA